MGLEIKTLTFNFDGKGSQSLTLTSDFSGTVNDAYAAMTGFYQKFDDDSQNVRTAEAAITNISPSSNSVNVTAILDIQPNNDKNMNGWITAIVIADVAE